MVATAKKKVMRRAPRDRAVPLEPVDPARCQCRKTVGAFSLGGLIGSERRCDERAGWISVEQRPGEDGQHGAMSLCDACKLVLERYIRDGKAPQVIFVELAGGRATEKQAASKRAKRLTAKELDRQKLEQLAAAEAMGDGLGALRDAEVTARKRGR